MKKIYSFLVFTFLLISIHGQLIISSNTTWSTNQTLTQPVKVNPGVTLTINPGIIVSVLFIDNNSDLIGDVIIDVKGSLVVNGDVCNKVQFKPYQVTTNKQYWTGINLDTVSTNNSIKGAVISCAKNGIVVENSNILANGVEINNCKTNGILAFGSSSILNINNCTISNCDEEGAKISNTSNCQLKYLKLRNNLASGLLLNSTTVTINNSVFYNNSKSGLFTLGSTITMNNSISRKNLRMGICINNSSLTGNYLDIDSNSVDGVFVGGSSTFNLQNSSIVKNTGFGVETTEYIVNSDFGNIALTNSTPSVSINNTNFIKNQNSSIVLTTNDIPGMNGSPYGIGYTSGSSGTYCQSLGNNCSAWSEICNNGFNPSPYSAWYNYQTFHVPFGRFENFVGSVSCNPNGGVSPTRFKCSYGISEGSNLQNPYWQWTPTPTSTNNPYSNCYPMSGGGVINSDKISFVSKYSGTDNPVVYSSIANSEPWSKFYIDFFSFRFGGFEFRSLVNNTSSTNNLTGNFWDTISPTNVINSVGAVLNINGFLINEIASSHSSLSNSYIYSNLNYFELAQNNSVFCTGANNILIAPSGNYTYSWMNGANSINNNNDSLQVSFNGNYSVSISGACVATSFPTSITLSSGNPISINASGPTTFCAGGSVTLTSPSSSGNLWSNGATTQSITVNNTGNYSLTVSNPQGCPSVSQTIQVNVTSLPTSPVISSSGNTTFCASGSVTLTSNLSGNIIWSNSQTTQSILVNSSGTYSAQIISNGCTSLPSNSIQVIVNPNPNNSVTASGSTTICQGNTVTLNAVASVGNSYQWFNNGVLIPNATNNSYTANASGSYTVDVTNSNGCVKTSTATTVTVNPLTTPTFTQVPAICSGATLSALPTTSNNSIAGTWSPALNNTTTTTYTFTPSSATAPTCATTTTMTITVNALPTATITAVGATSFCQGASVVLNANTGAGLNYQWKNNGTNISGATAASYTASTAGSYSVVVTNSNGCIKTSTATTVNVNPLTTPTFTQVPAICSGATLSALPTTSNNSIVGTWSPALNNTSTTTYTFTPSSTASPTCATTTTMAITVNPLTAPTFSQITDICSGATLNPLPTTSNNSITGSWSPTLNNTTTTTYTFTPTSTASPTCATTTTMAITVNALPTATIAAGGATTFCQGASVVLIANTEAGLTYQWKNNGINITGETGGSYTALSNGNYSVEITNSYNCSATSLATSVTVNPLTTPSFTQVNAICSGGNLNPLPTTSSNNIIGTWSPNINNLATTTYTFSPSVNQCANATTMTIVINDPIVPTFTQIFPICYGISFALPSVSNENIIGTWSPQINNLQTTTYTFTPISNQCATNQSMTVVVNPNPLVTLNSFSQICDTLGVYILTGGSPLGGTYSGTSVSNNTFQTSTGLGTYPITYSYTDINNCMSSANQNLTVIDCSGVGFVELTENEISIYPNPTDNIFTIEVSEFIIGQTFAIFDIRGRLLLNGNLNETKTLINVSSFATGTYYVNLPESNKMMKIIKQ